MKNEYPHCEPEWILPVVGRIGPLCYANATLFGFNPWKSHYLRQISSPCRLTTHSSWRDARWNLTISRSFKASQGYLAWIEVGNFLKLSHSSDPCKSYCAVGEIRRSSSLLIVFLSASKDSEVLLVRSKVARSGRAGWSTEPKVRQTEI